MTAEDLPVANEGPPELPPEGPHFDRRMLEALICPQTHAPLRFDAERQELISKAAHLAYPIRGGIPVMLADEARQLED
ncbi:Trm112 family protein [Roseisalinus antarcticus]|uniref:UPF0434 protein ROA7023_01739 n=1 Tax=Roseisalinus antarcticus TaxID=254357 RepID=A0A1Y5SQA6_9RHOB|nr:Trm112 family protein [Roseisalinus antarcticus]SLN42900.1 hypothetical protein ROA7023_01739 [Roseisalinus antarcticus]